MPGQVSGHELDYPDAGEIICLKAHERGCNPMAVGIAVGVALGLALGLTAFDNIGLGVACGIAAGAAGGYFLERGKHR